MAGATTRGGSRTAGYRFAEGLDGEALAEGLVIGALGDPREAEKAVARFELVMAAHGATGQAARSIARECVGRALDRATAAERLVAGDRGIVQRTPAWYEARRGMVTGSEMRNALTATKAFLAKKARDARAAGEATGGGAGGSPARAEPTGETATEFLARAAAEASASRSSPALEWGVMFEPVACALYERFRGVRVHEFGLMAHRDIQGFGASPDGVTDAGVMLEIKCPYTRDPDGPIPEGYFWQMQAQMEVLDLDACDFLQCVFELSGGRGGACEGGEDTGELESGGVASDGEVVFGKDATPEWLLAAESRGLKAWLWRLRKWDLRRVARDRGFFEEIKPCLLETISKLERQQEGERNDSRGEPR